GPYMENFKEELNLMLDKKAIVQLNSTDDLKNTLLQLLDDLEYRKGIEENTRKLSHNVAQVLEDYTKLILK
ncbi:MAG: hypothetical protein KAT90_03625, partial [Gammaproteobacteria bacterium]|nr:hypothetical protein [Gammaproteobacteria bacterium]